MPSVKVYGVESATVSAGAVTNGVGHGNLSRRRQKVFTKNPNNRLFRNRAAQPPSRFLSFGLQSATAAVSKLSPLPLRRSSRGRSPEVNFVAGAFFD